MLPSIAPYALPDADSLPDNRVDWAVDPSRCALLIHDMQHYFVDVYPADSHLVCSVVDNIARLRDAADAAGVPVYYTAQPPNQHPSDRGLLTDFWGPGLEADGRAQIIGALAPRDHDTVLTMWRYDAFVRSDFEDHLAAQRRDQLLITGVYTHIGCQTTAASAFMRDIRPFLVADATADFTAVDHQASLRYVARRCGKVVSVDEVASAVAGGPHRAGARAGGAPTRATVGAGS